MTFLTVFRKEILEFVRTGRLVILAAVLVFFGMTSPVAAKFLPQLIGMLPGTEQFAGLVPEPTILDAVAQFIKNVAQFGILVALLLTMGSVTQEVDKGTAALVLVKPLPRPVFILAKFAALGLAFLVVLKVTSLLAYYYTLVLFNAPDAGAWIGMTALIGLYLLVYIALTLLFSTLFRSQAAAAGAAFGVLLVLGIIGSIPAFGQYLPGQLIDWSGRLFTGSTQTYWPAVVVSLGVIVGSLALAVIRFNRQEL